MVCCGKPIEKLVQSPGLDTQVCAQVPTQLQFSFPAFRQRSHSEQVPRDGTWATADGIIHLSVALSVQTWTIRWRAAQVYSPTWPLVDPADGGGSAESKNWRAVHPRRWILWKCNDSSWLASRVEGNEGWLDCLPWWFIWHDNMKWCWQFFSFRHRRARNGRWVCDPLNLLLSSPGRRRRVNRIDQESSELYFVLLRSVQCAEKNLERCGVMDVSVCSAGEKRRLGRSIFFSRFCLTFERRIVPGSKSHSSALCVHNLTFNFFRQQPRIFVFFSTRLILSPLKKEGIGV